MCNWLTGEPEEVKGGSETELRIEFVIINILLINVI